MYNSKLLKFIAEQNLANEYDENEKRKGGKNSKTTKERHTFSKNSFQNFAS